MFVALGPCSDAIAAMRAGSPEATIAASTASDPKDVVAVYTDVSTAHEQFSAQPHLLFIDGDSDFCGEALSVWTDRLCPGGYLLVHAHSEESNLIRHAPSESELTNSGCVGGLWLFRKEGGCTKKTPLVSFVTRTYQRPRQLGLNIASLKAQGDMDYEHLVIVDDDGKGLFAANKSLPEAKDRIRGQYVMILDDDDALLDPGFVGGIRSIEHFKGKPQLIVFKIWRLTEIVPSGQYWGLEQYDEGNGHRVCNCYCVRKDFFLETIDGFGVPRAGDQNWQKVMYGLQPSIYWWDHLASYNMRIGRSEPEREG